MTTKLMIDADPGIGDALAIALAVFDEELDVLAVTATSGSVSGRKATRNIEAITGAVDPPKWPRMGSCERVAPYVDSELLAEAVRPIEMNGESGLGDWPILSADLAHRHESERLLIDIARAHPNEITLLTLGPLTNVDLACEREPDFLQMLNRIVCLGGAVGCGGDITAAAEFNMYADPDAARNVLCSPATKTLVPLDVSSEPTLTFDQFDRLETDADSSSLGRFLGEILPYSLRAHHEHLGFEGIHLQEVVALASIARPELFETEPMLIDVETSGELTRGMTVFDRRSVGQWQTNIDVVTRCDSQSIVDYLTTIVKKAK